MTFIYIILLVMLNVSPNDASGEGSYLRKKTISSKTTNNGTTVGADICPSDTTTLFYNVDYGKKQCKLNSHGYSKSNFFTDWACTTPCTTEDDQYGIAKINCTIPVNRSKTNCTIPVNCSNINITNTMCPENMNACINAAVPLIVFAIILLFARSALMKRIKIRSTVSP